MQDIQELYIDILDTKIYEEIYAKQYDIGREVHLIVTRDGTPIALDNVSASLELKKPDNTVIIKSCSIKDNQVIVDIDRNITVIAGRRIPYQLQLYSTSSQAVICTTTGYINIDKSTVTMDDVESSSDFSTFSDILLKFNTEYEEVKKDVNEVKASKDYMNNLVKTTEERWSNMIQLKNSQADYDKLSNEQKMNGTLYFVKN